MQPSPRFAISVAVVASSLVACASNDGSLADAGAATSSTVGVPATTTPSPVSFCEAVSAERDQPRVRRMLNAAPLPKRELEQTLALRTRVFDAMVRAADDPVLRGELQGFQRVQSALIEAVIGMWGTDGTFVTDAADAWPGDIAEFVMRDGLDVDGDEVSAEEYAALEGDILDRLSVACDERPADWVAVHDLPPATVPAGLRYFAVVRLSGELALGVGSATVPVIRVPVPDETLRYSRPSVSPDGGRLLVEGARRDGSAEFFVGSLDSLPALERIDRLPGQSICPSWSPDGASVVVSLPVGPRQWTQIRLGLGSGEVDELFPPGSTTPEPPCGVLYDDETLLVTASKPDEDGGAVWRQAVGSDARTVFASIPGCTTIYPQVRPGTREVAVITACEDVYDNGLWVQPDDPSRPPRHVLRGLVAAPVWSDDGEWILFGYQSERGAAPELWIASADGETASQLLTTWSSWPAWIPESAECSFCP